MTEGLDRHWIVGGEVVLPTGVVLADVLIEKGRIHRIETHDPKRTVRGEDFVDASGTLVTPGGIDAHTHLDHQSSYRTTDDFAIGTASAVLGGTTTILDFALKPDDQGLYPFFQNRLAKAVDESYCDVGLHSMIGSSGVNDHTLNDMKKLWFEGHASVKLLMAYPGRMMVDDSTILRVMKEASRAGAVVMFHAENGAVVEEATRACLSEGRSEPLMHLDSHPEVAELEAIRRIIDFSEWTQCKSYIVHVSSGRGAQAISAAKRTGRLSLHAETCPQYLSYSSEQYAGDVLASARAKCSPPIRESANARRLWSALLTGGIDVVATDHAAYGDLKESSFHPGKTAEERQLVEGAGIPNGVPGVYERMMVLYEDGVQERGMALEHFVDLTATNPAKIFGLFPRKGVLQPGSDADVVIWNRDRRALSASDAPSTAGYSLYEGKKVGIFPRHVFVRGRPVVEDGNLVAAAGWASAPRRNV